MRGPNNPVQHSKYHGCWCSRSLDDLVMVRFMQSTETSPYANAEYLSFLHIISMSQEWSHLGQLFNMSKVGANPFKWTRCFLLIPELWIYTRQVEQLCISSCNEYTFSNIFCSYISNFGHLFIAKYDCMIIGNGIFFVLPCWEIHMYIDVIFILKF